MRKPAVIEIAGAVKVLPEAIKALRTRHPKGAMTQDGLSKATGLGLSTIGMIESGDRQPSLQAALAIAAALGVTIDAFAFVDPQVRDSLNSERAAS